MKTRIIIILIGFYVLTFSAKAQEATLFKTAKINVSDSIMSLFIAAAEVDSLLYIEDVCPEIDTTGRKPVLLIHGWGFDGAPAPPGGGYWDYFREYLRNDPELSSNYKPYYVRYWSNYVSVAEIAKELRRKIEEAGLNNKRILIIAHSMGGLISRSYMEENYFTSGPKEGEKCGVLVDQLITLGTPHHGSPMANYEARNDKYSFFYKTILSVVESTVFNDLPYNKVNRSDLRWDNYNGIMNYADHPSDANDWLSQLNNASIFDSKIICYSGATNGELSFPEIDNVDEQYAFLAGVQEVGFEYINDGIVPIISAQFDKHKVKETRHFDGYNHADLNRGKEGSREVLFDFLKVDLFRSKPLRLLQPGIGNKENLRYNQHFEIAWDAPDHITTVNIYFSQDNGKTYNKIAAEIDAQQGTYTWVVPDLNADNCRIKISDADFEYEYAISSSSFTVYHSNIDFELTSDSYFVNYRNDTIKWQYEGLMCSATLIYYDTKNDTSFVIDDNIELFHGQSYSALLAADTTRPASRQVYLEIVLNDMDDRYNDPSDYSFTSSNIQNLGNPIIRLLSPTNIEVAIDKEEGAPYIIDETVSIIFESEGEILHLELYACDSVGNNFDTIYIDTNEDRILTENSIEWKIPNHRGSNFYYHVKAGVTADSIIAEDYSEYPFRINYQTKIAFPTDGQSNVSLLPCFETEPFDGASEYAYTLQHADSTTTWGKNYTSGEANLCIPNLISEELKPNTKYRLTAKADINGIWTYADTIDFTSEAEQPYDFVIVNPEENDSLKGDSLLVVWQHAVGAEYYKIEVVQGDVIYEHDNIAHTDTTAVVDISSLLYNTAADIIVYAYNQFGLTAAFKTILKSNTSKLNTTPEWALNVHPNPLSNNAEAKIEIKAAYNTPINELSLYTITGKLITTINPKIEIDGNCIINWQYLTNNRKLESGTYILQLRTLNNILREKILVK